ncbi:hypothetical protein Taro_013867 [Colocasia esculenta]|uniref:Aberrant panicle organization 1 protein n=1 Tax=Colocasia esculenta TaxID=4460 RepID=A0A843UD27_COLES|nr:hypothetical protein [Colocasia esculenta]
MPRCGACGLPVLWLHVSLVSLSDHEEVEGSLWRSDAVERPRACAERRRVRGARRRRPTDREGPFVGWFLRSKSGGDVQPVAFLVATGWPSRSPLRFSSRFCSEGGTLAVTFGVATGQSSRSTFWGSDDALVAFSPPCRLAASQWPHLWSGLLTLNATGRYVAFRSEGGPLVVVTWTPILGSLLREYSGLQVCSSWQPTSVPGCQSVVAPACVVS